MIPLVALSFFHHLLPESGVHQLMAPVKEALPFPTDPYFCMLIAFFLIYVPMGIRLMFQFDYSKNPLTMVMWVAGGFLPNTTPRKSIKELTEGSAAMDRLQGSHLNQLEGFPLFAAGVLSAMQAGVDPAVVSDYALLYCIARIGYVIFYNISFVNTLGFIRTNCWFACLGIQTKLFLLASAATRA